MHSEHNEIWGGIFWEEKMKTRTHRLTLCAVFAAIIAICSVIAIPVGEIPVTLGLFGVMLSGIILGPRLAAVSAAVYILLGAIGLPVFSGFRGGFQVIAGPTGGYLAAYVPAAALSGMLSRVRAKPLVRMLLGTLGCLASVCVSYAFGTVWFVILTKSTYAAAIWECVLPFVPFDAAKAVCAAVFGVSVLRRLEIAGIYEK